MSIGEGEELAAGLTEAILGAVTDGISVQDENGRLVYANDAAARLVGFGSADELLAAEPDELLARFELLDEFRRTLPLDELPGRIALTQRGERTRTLCWRIRATGEERWSVVRALPVELNGTALAVNVFRDVTDQKRVADQLRLLADASELLVTSLDLELTVGAIGAMLVPGFADYCLIDLQGDDGSLRQVVLHHHDAAKERVLRELRHRYPPDANPAHPVMTAVSSGDPVLIEWATDDDLRSAAVDDQHLELYRALEPSSYLVVPLTARSRTIGAMSLGMGSSRRRYGGEDIVFAQEVAGRIALAVDNARLYDTARSSYALLDTLLVSAPVGIGFWDKNLRFVRVNDALAAINGLPAEEHPGLTLSDVKPDLAETLEPLYRRVMETGQPIAHGEATDESGVRPGDRRYWLSSYYPVRAADGEVTGVGAVIMDVSAQRRADERLRLLARAGELFASSLDADDVFARIADVVVPRLADSLHIFLGAGDRLERVACANVDPELVPVMESLPSTYPLGADSPAFMAKVFESAEPVLFDDVSTDFYDHLEQFGAAREAMQQVGSRSLMLVPLVARGQALGVLVVGSREPGRYTDDDLALTLELAGRASVAIDNARLFHEVSFRRTLLEAQQEASIDGLLLVSPDGELLSYNRRFSEIWQLSDEVVASGSDAAALANAVNWVQDPDAFLARVHDAYERRAPTRDELVLVDGRTIERHGRPVRDDAGAYHGYLWSFRDVSEARRAERALRDAQATLEAAASAARVGTWYWDIAANAAVADEFISSAFGVDPAEGAAGAPSDQWFGGIHPDDRARVQAALGAAVEAGGEYEEEFRVIGADGTERWVLSRGLVETDGSGRGARILGAVADITARKRDERELARRAQVARALEFVADGVFLLDHDGVVRLWNPAAAAITGVAEEDAVGRPLGERVPGWKHLEQLVPVAESTKRANLRAETLPVDVEGRELWLSISGVAFREGVVYAFRDLTEERGVDRLKSDFVATVSHELRTPLAAIYGAAMTLRRADVPLSPVQRDGMLDVVSGEAERLARIVNDILLASRLDSDIVDVSLERTDAAELARAVVAAAAAHLPPRIELTLHAADDLPAVEADADKLRQVLVNLVENAVKYSPDGGPVDVHVATRDERMRFSVVDEGLGIPVGEHARIFEKFYRLDPNLTRGVGGTGLGLYICREIVRRMNGRIWVESQPGRGSAFHVELPLA